MNIYIKYMVSLRCKLLVRDTLNNLKIKHSSIELGLVNTCDNVSEQKLAKFADILKESGLIVLDDKRSILIEKIKNVIVGMIHYSDETPTENYSDYISEKLGYDYTYLANVFSEVKGITIQHFIILHKIERVKELLLYDELNLSEISYQLNYSSVAHLSTQFKKITGLTPSFYKQLGQKRKENLEDL
jgi:AraC-like DNA-binding protein